MTLAALVLAVVLSAPQADPKPSQIEAGCAYVPGSGEMTAVDVGVFFESPTPSFVDERYRAVRVGSGWQRSDRSPYSGGATHAWFRDGAQVSFDGQAFTKWGFPRILDREVLTVVGEHDGVAVLREAGNPAPDVIYIQTTGGQCEFQPYKAG